MGVKKSPYLPIPLIITHKKSKFARVDNFYEKFYTVTYAIRYYFFFVTFLRAL